MKFNLDDGRGQTHINNYQAHDHIRVNGQSYQHSLLLTPTAIVRWSPIDWQKLTAADFTQALDLNQGFILFGSGDTHRFLSPDLLTEFTTRGIAIEMMATDAACRTFNILMSENRPVTAALLL